MRRDPILLMAAVSAFAQTYADDIHPLFAKRCAGCHAQGAKLGEFQVNTYEQLIKGGNRGRTVVPGDAGSSLLYLMLSGKETPTMPMDGTFLSAGEIETVKKWIDAGAKGPSGADAARISAGPKPGAAPVLKPRPGKARVLGAALHGNLAALAGHREVRLAAMPGAKTVATLGGHAGPVRNVEFSADGKLLAAAGGLCAEKGEVKIWDVEKRTATVTIAGHSDCIYGIAFSPDGKTLATSSYDKLIKLWDVETGREIRTLKDHIDAVYAVRFTPDGKRLISGGADRTVKVWDPATGVRLFTLSESTDGINTVAVAPDGKRIAAGGIDKSVRVWSLSGTSGELLQSSMAHEDAILKIAWSPDGKSLVTSSADKSLKVLRASDLAEIRVLPGQSDWAYGLQFSADGRNLLVGRMDGSTDWLDAAMFAAGSRTAMR